jgi:CRP/FNR family cyclic AMP-dependent transcriptional regulator
MNSFTKTFKPGSHLFMENDFSRELYVIQTGSVKVYRKSTGGKELELAMLGKGSVLGEMALIDGKPRSASAKALEETTVSIVDADTFNRKVKGIPQWFLSIIRVISLKIRKANDRLKKTYSSNTGVSIVLTLNYLFARNGAEKPLDLAATKKNLIQFLGIAQKRIVHVLQLLEKMGCIEVQEDRIVPVDPRKLNDCCAFLRGMQRKVFDKLEIISNKSSQFVVHVGDALAVESSDDSARTPIPVETLSEHAKALNAESDLSFILSELRDLKLIVASKNQDDGPEAKTAVSIANTVWRPYYLYCKYKDCLPCF